MKKSKFLKILAPIVALGLLIGALVGINASANTDALAEGAPEIISMNVEYGSELYLYYAVDAGGAEGAPRLEVLSDAQGSDVEYTVTEYTEVTVHGTACYVFKTAGVAPKELNKAQYVRAVVGDAASEIKSASVEDYLNIRLYKNGFAAKTAADGEDYTRRNLYFQLLKYGSSAQALFDGSATDKIGATGVLVKGASALSGVYAYGDYVKLAAPAVEGSTFSYWQVDEYSVFGEATATQRLLADGYEYVITNNSAIITPVYDVEAPEDVEAWDSGVIHFNEFPATSNLLVSSSWKTQLEANSTLIGENKWDVVTLEDGNNVLYIDKDCNNKFADGTAQGSNCGVRITTYPTKTEDGATVAVFEARILADNVTSNSGIQIDIYGRDSNGSERQPVKLYYDTANLTSKLRYQDYVYNLETKKSAPVNTDEYYRADMGVAYGEWFTLRIEYRTVTVDGVKSVEYKTYINDNFIATSDNINDATAAADTSKLPDAGRITRVTLAFNNGYLGDFYLDDMSLKLIAE